MPTPVIKLTPCSISDFEHLEQRSQITYHTNNRIIEFFWNSTTNCPIIDNNRIYYNINSVSINNNQITMRHVLRSLNYNIAQITLDWFDDNDNNDITVDSVLDSPIATVILNQMTISSK
jgi:hypothetical protein